MTSGIDLARAMGNKEHADAIEAMKEQLLIILIERLGGKASVSVAEVDTGTIGKALEMRLNPNTRMFEFGVRRLTAPLEPLKPAAAPSQPPTQSSPVDRSATTLTDGSPVTPDHRELRPDGMQKGYVVLSDSARLANSSGLAPTRRSEPDRW